MNSTPEAQQSTDNAKVQEAPPMHVHGPNCNHHHALMPVVRSAPKVGRNDPCSCGSNKKFKKCCGAQN